VAISINLSPRQLNDPSLVDVVGSAIQETRIDPDKVCLEITESAAIDAPDESLISLKGLGVTLALDDFGTGFSSLNQIRSLPPVDALKIDRSFVAELGWRSADRAIVGAIIGIARALRLETVAEGIERAGQLDALRALGCDRGQGFYFSRPMTAGAVDQLLGEQIVQKAALALVSPGRPARLR
jgi:EAL domain-containing protein (putative c-di-GMP-specific phosphodiesterase class I)